MVRHSAANRLDEVLRTLPERYPGPGGAAAVMKDGRVLETRAWGYADAERGVAFSAASLFRMCSITKQFTCALVLSRHPDPSSLDGAARRRLPSLRVPAPRAIDLCNNQSGLRDYWTLAMMQGAAVEGAFGDRETSALLGGIQSLQFEPGSRYSYANQNFRLLSDALAEEAQTPFADLLRREIFDHAGMETAFLAADTAAMPDGSTGYEGSRETGHRPAVNHIIWTGDAGLGASLNDMIAWERWIDAGAQREDSLYARLAAPPRFCDGRPAAYGFGLAHGTLCGRAVVGHGGALRGWRSHRLYCASERISVVVMFNHLSDAHGAAAELFAAALGEGADGGRAACAAPPGICGAFLEPETGIAVSIDAAPHGGALVRYGHHPEHVGVPSEGGLGSEAGDLVIALDGEEVRMIRRMDNQSTTLVRLGETSAPTLEGLWRCDETQSTLRIEDAGGVLYARFEGVLGHGRFEALEAVGGGVRRLPCRRALDHTPPGAFTLAPEGVDGGAPERLRVGCWLARNLMFERAR